jgi:5'-nucleotidase
MKRKDFLKYSASAGAFIGLGGLTATASTFETENSLKHITILHTNDVHSHVRPFPESDPNYPNKGGVARRYSLIQKIREENPNTLLLDAGDIFQGTPFFNFYGGEIEFKLMSKLGYDAATLGNHDFDNGTDGLNAQLPNAEFPFIISNYDFSNTVLDGKTKPYQIFKKAGVKIGVFGLGIELDGLVSKKNYKETQYLNPVEIAQQTVKTLKNEKACDLLICLSHLGYHYNSEKIDDKKLAQQTQDIDLILGGHTHTFLEKPTLVKNNQGKNVIINQVGWAGLNLGRIDFYLNHKNGNYSAEGLPVEV